MNVHLHHRICLSGTLITARAVASLKVAEGNQLFFRVQVVENERGERSFAV